MSRCDIVGTSFAHSEKHRGEYNMDFKKAAEQAVGLKQAGKANCCQAVAVALAEEAG